MSGSHRNSFRPIIDAVFVVTLVALVIGMIWDVASKNAYDQIQSKSYGEHYSSEADQRIERDCAKREGAALVECVKEVIETSHEQQRDENDLAAQRGMERWAFWMLVATLGSVAVTTIGVVYVALTLREARETTAAAFKGADAAEESVAEARKATKFAQDSTDIARETMLASDRPWINIKAKMAADLIFTDTTVSAAIQCTFKNIGKSPAVQVSVARVKMFADVAVAAMTADDDTRKEMQNYSFWSSYGRAMFPEDDFSDEWGVEMDASEFKARIAELDKEVEEPFNTNFPAVLIGIRYLIPGDRQYRFTYMTFEIKRGYDLNRGFDGNPSRHQLIELTLVQSFMRGQVR